VYASNTNRETVETLLDAGALINEPIAETALYRAIHYGNMEVFLFLMGRNADF
jgi:hypothetical protein